MLKLGAKKDRLLKLGFVGLAAPSARSKKNYR